jgi:hypothetical protein
LASVLLAAAPASATLMTGPAAQTFFQGLGGTYVDFATTPVALAVGTNLTTQVPGITFASITNTAGGPAGPFHVEVSAAPGRQNTIVGAPCGGCSDDGRVGYEMVFDSPHNHAGLLRIWNASTQTLFYNNVGALLDSHAGTGFVGWVGDGSASQQVKRIVIDTIGASNARQVGYSDDLYFGASIPEPSSWALFAVAAVALARRRKGLRAR